MHDQAPNYATKAYRMPFGGLMMGKNGKNRAAVNEIDGSNAKGSFPR